MLRKKLLATLTCTTVCVCAAMLVDYLITIRLLHDPQGYTPFVTFAIATIVTLPTSYALIGGWFDLGKARDDLAAARDEAIQASRSKSHFLANMSHELRTPLNAIIGFSELLSLDAFAGKRGEYAKLIHASGVHLLGLVNDLLDLSRIEAGKLELQCEILSLAELIDECVATVQPRARDGAIVLVRKIEPDLPFAFADRRALKQILLNLLINAVKFSRTGGTVEVFAKLAPSGEIAFGVLDYGVGIAEEDQGRVFERFGQGRHDVATAEIGAGLGLPIVKGLVDAHGGHISLDSKIAKGTRMTVWLPAERVRPRTEIPEPIVRLRRAG